MEKKNNPSTRKAKEAKPLLSQVAAKLKGKDLFPEKIDRAKKFFTKVKSFPS